MQATLAGGPLAGASLDIASNQSDIRILHADGTMHIYHERFGRVFSIGPLGRKFDESALFLHTTICDMEILDALTYLDAQGI